MTEESANSHAAQRRATDRGAGARTRFPRCPAPTSQPKAPCSPNPYSCCCCYAAASDAGRRGCSHARCRPECRPDASRRARWRAESGAVAAELVIATPLLLLLILGVVQFALWEHATNLAEAAAQQGLSVARLQGETARAGTAETESVLAQLAGGVLVGPQVSATRTGATTTVVVSGHAESVVGIFSLPVRATAVGPTEPPAPNAQGAGP